MKLLVTMEEHYQEWEGQLYSPVTGYDRFWSRYRKVFEEIVILARVRRAREQPNLPRATGPGVAYMPVPDFWGPWQYLKKMRQVGKAVRRAVEACDAYLLRVPGTMGNLVWRKVRRKGLPFGVEVVGDPWDSLSPGSFQSVLRPYFRRSYSRLLRRQCREAATASYVTSEALQRSYPTGPRAFVTHYSSVELPRSAIVEDLSRRVASLAGIPRRLAGQGEPVRVGYIGTFSAMYKAPDVHIRALARCVGQGRNLVLEMVGEGPHAVEMKELARELGVEDRVIFRGSLSGGQEIFDFLDTLDVFCNASRQEGLPRALIEAMSRGCPAIGSAVGGIPELLEPDCLVPSNDPDALAQTMLALLKDAPRLRKSVSRNVKVARRYVKEVLDQRRFDHFTELKKRTAAARGA